MAPVTLAAGSGAPARVLYLIRGLPGSGKSTLARLITDHVYENDDAFYDANGVYHGHGPRTFRATLEAVKLCRRRVDTAMRKGETPIAVANCHLTAESMDPLRQMAARHGYAVATVICADSFGSVHSVPPSELDRMRALWRWE